MDLGRQEEVGEFQIWLLRRDRNVSKELIDLDPIEGPHTMWAPSGREAMNNIICEVREDDKVGDGCEHACAFSHLDTLDARVIISAKPVQPGVDGIAF